MGQNRAEPGSSRSGRLPQDKTEEARREVNSRVVRFLSQENRGETQKLLPIKVVVDNESSPVYTVMDIRGEDTPAFLYLFTNALAMRGVDIRNIRISTQGGR